LDTSSSFRQQIIPFTAWWLFWILAQAVVLHRLHFSWEISFADAAVSNVLLALAGYIITNTFKYYSTSTSNYVYRIGYITALTFLCMTALCYAMPFLFPVEQEYLAFLNTSTPVRYMLAFLMIAFVTVFNGLRFYIREQDENKKRKNEAELLMRDAELAKLRQQLQPHFLFNSLNSISALAGSRPEQARLMIQQLSDFLRGTLKKDEQQLVQLSEELNHLQLYLEIEKVRFGYRLKTDIVIDEKSKEMKLPPLLLQPLVENAIKFGLYDTTGEITISIRATAENNNLHIQIQNPFDAETSTPRAGTGFGLAAVQKRLHLVYSRNDLLSVQQHQNIFTTNLIVPQTL
jgi:sensor histidine kinase YesM